jgi:hypothetical protein
MTSEQNKPEAGTNSLQTTISLSVCENTSRGVTFFQSKTCTYFETLESGNSFLWLVSQLYATR